MNGWGADTPELAAEVYAQWGGHPFATEQEDVELDDEPKRKRHIARWAFRLVTWPIVAGVAARIAVVMFEAGWRLF